MRIPVQLLSKDNMAEAETFFTIFWILFCACLIAPPTEFVSAGLTVQNLLSNFLGSEDMNFIYYHMKRTAFTPIFHSLLPLGYYLGMALFSTPVRDVSYFMPWTMSYYWRLYLAVCLILPLCATTLAYYWSRNKWSNHHIAKSLQLHAPAGSSWTAVASSINIEFRRIDKFTTGMIGRRVIVTDTWVVRTSTYDVNVAHQGDVHLLLLGTDEHNISHESSTGVQYLNINVISSKPNVKPFQIRLNSLEYSDLRTKLSSRVINARNVVIQQSLTDRFLEAFREQVTSNAPVSAPRDVELEPCIGCMQTTANIKLQKLCDNHDEGDCVQCNCRPMWCLECMSKWFASRQNQNEPERWLSRKAPCPTCRSKFCMLDVCKIV